MVRVLLATVLILLCSLPVASAQDTVRVRAGDHTGYSRFVFDWPSRGNYTANKNEGTLTLKFTKAATLSGNSQHGTTLRNISGFTTLSNEPFEISVQVPADSDTRHFWAGDRLILDVYDSPSGKKNTLRSASKKTTQAKEKKPVPKAREENTVIAEDLPVPKVTPKKAEKPAEEKHEEKHEEAPDITEEAMSEAPKVGTHKIEKPRKNITEPPEAEKEKHKEADMPPLGKESAVTLSTTQVTGLAAFEMNGLLWMINDREGLIIQPKVMGEAGQAFVPADSEAQVSGGTTFTYIPPENMRLRGEGGGLIWRVISTHEDVSDKAQTPIRQGAGKSVRGGRILWPIKNTGEILTMDDPVTGAPVRIVTVKNADAFSGAAYDFVDFKVLPSVIGMAIMPKVDNLDVKLTPEGVEISRPEGLALSDERDVQLASARRKKHDSREEAQHRSGVASPRIFDFEDWQMGHVSVMAQNRTIILSNLGDLSDGEKIAGMLKIAKLFLAHAHGIEAIGFLDLAEESLSELRNNPEYLALRGASKAITWENEEAFGVLSSPSLDTFEEVGYWRAFTLANLGDWEQAYRVLPPQVDVLKTYPDLLFHRLAPVIAEIMLRAGDVDGAQPLLEQLEEQKDDLFREQLAALAYLQGESTRQRGDVEKTKIYWEPLTTGPDDFYRAKAGLALTRLLQEKKEISLGEAINRLERLRYAWRGDDLETQIHYWLGKAYFENGEYAKALSILREAASYAVNQRFSQKITTEMREMFTGLFLGDELDNVQPEDAVALYEQFSELIPPGKEGDMIAEELADRLSQADLLGRASALLSKQLEHRAEGEDAIRVGMRLAVAQLNNDRPDEALSALNKAEAAFLNIPEEQKNPATGMAIALMRARALSQQGRPDQALLLLEKLDTEPDVNRLRADIAWNAGYWDDAAEALGEMIIDHDISLTRPLEAEDASLILQRGVALNLADDRIGLANHREKYADPMAQTDKSGLFDVVTRPRQNATLADRQTLMNMVAETDLFAEFLDKYKDAASATE